MNKYELLTIYSASITDEQLENLIKKYSGIVENNGGHVLSVDKWGIKKFAYPIHYQKEGHYVLYTFESDAIVPSKITTAENIDDLVYRSLCLRKDA